MKSSALVPLALVLVACSSQGDEVDLGDDQIGTAEQSLADYQGSWDGYTEAFKFDSGSDRVRILLDEAGHGSIQFGDAPPLEPFSDPNVGYPESETFTGPLLPDYARPREGFDYPVYEATVTDGRIEFVAWGTDLVADFCAAQTHIVSESGNYTCSPTGFGWGEGDSGCMDARINGSDAIVDCGLIKTCVFGCSCDATSCSAVRHPGHELTFDGALGADGHELVGTLVGPERITVRLTRP